MANPYITAETEKLLREVARLYDLPTRRNRTTKRQSVNISAAIRKAAKVAIAAAQTPGDRELARERKEKGE